MTSKYIKTLDKFLDIMKSKSKPNFYENEKDQIATDLITACKKADLYDELQDILEEYNVTPENIREVLLTGQMFRNQPTLEECIKEWEERGWKTSYIYDGINLSKLNDGIEEYFYFDKDLKRIDCNCFISFDLLPLIHKTLKALEVEE